jgi:release factor glutamine methyltransferase
MLAPDGVLLLVQSSLSDEARTLDRLRATGLTAEVVDRRWLPFGPVLQQQRAWLLAGHRIAADQYEEELVVIRARR